MAVSILLATLEEAEVFRRDPTSEDLADPATYVVNIGMQYDPDMNNFDHHQDSSLPCAFHLIMQHLGYHEDAQLVYGWYPLMSMMSRGRTKPPSTLASMPACCWPLLLLLTAIFSPDFPGSSPLAGPT